MFNALKNMDKKSQNFIMNNNEVNYVWKVKVRI